jgi:Fic family protein
MKLHTSYTITNILLANIKRITELVAELNSRPYSKVVLMEMEARANSLSTFASTSIEGNPLPLTEVKRIVKNHPTHIRDSEREVLNYNTTLIWLNQLVTQGEYVLDEQIILTAQHKVVDGLLSESRLGKWRSEPVFVNNPQTGTPIYLPPDHQDVRELMAQLLSFITEEGNRIDPLIIAGIFHKQFVIIHPFVDGNGRTARLMTKLLLARMGLNTFNLFSFENYYNKNVSSYFDRVGVRGNYYEIKDTVDFTSWLEYFTSGIIDELLRVSKELFQITVTPKTVLRDYHKKVISYINEHGFITDAEYAKLTTRARATRHKDFRRLLELGLIESHGAGKATYYKDKKS